MNFTNEMIEEFNKLYKETYEHRIYGYLDIHKSINISTEALEMDEEHLLTPEEIEELTP